MGVVLGEFDEICEGLGVPWKVKEKTEDLRKSIEEFSFTGQKRKGIYVATFYAACRKMGVPRSYKELADASGVSNETIIKSLKFLSEKLDLHLPPYDPRDCVTYLVEKLDLSESVGDKAKQILEKANEENLVAGRNPFGVSAAAIQMACSSEDVEITYKKIADAATITTVSIRSSRKEMKDELDSNFS
ncbi:hypothetical protein AKJ64_02525 [candidate division MSBL1 archaeon SCGC-AAA259E17]|uniref:Transcription factor TFIIB cyclin-like domain-containing protein n=1 Tax=candidate division MSBL1 archaeon SCGC-AAA259E17 TaxID=1698263 RepID=A0A133UEP2_9EURY|nr:hypothetical protein AKJ64_02525 [candidate division MSBL1 archaeon SCGC-AAA259E17]